MGFIFITVIRAPYMQTLRVVGKESYERHKLTEISSILIPATFGGKQ